MAEEKQVNIVKGKEKGEHLGREMNHKGHSYPLGSKNIFLCLCAWWEDEHKGSAVVWLVIRGQSDLPASIQVQFTMDSHIFLAGRWKARSLQPELSAHPWCRVIFGNSQLTEASLGCILGRYGDKWPKWRFIMVCQSWRTTNPLMNGLSRKRKRAPVHKGCLPAPFPLP